MMAYVTSEMESKNIGWEHDTPVSGNRKIVRYNYCEK